MRRHVLAALLTATAVLGSSSAAGPTAAEASARAAAPACQRHSTEIARSGGATLWTDARGRALFSCARVAGGKVVNGRLGPWSGESQASIGRNGAVWTVRRGGVDRVSVADLEFGYVWLTGVLPTVGKGSGADLRVSRVLALDEAAAWVTTQGAVMLAVATPDLDPRPVGPTLPGATVTPPISTLTGTPQGLATPLKKNWHRLLVGRWEALAGDTFAGSLTLEKRQGEGDECGGTDPYTATVETAPGERVGATWWSTWSNIAAICD